MKLIDRPRFISGESWPGYLMRLAEANGGAGLSYICQMLDWSTYQLIAASPFTTLPLFGVGCEELTKEEGQILVPWRRYMNLGTFGRSIYSRVCPKCLASDKIPHIRAAWDLALQVDCADHHCLLIDECPQCHCRLEHTRRSLTRCNCGFDLKLCRTRPARNLYATIQQTFGLADSCASRHTTFAGSSKQECAALEVLLRLLAQDRPRPKPRNYAGKIPSSQAFVRASDLDELEEWFRDWPNGFICNLNRCKCLRKQRRTVMLNSSTLLANQFPLIRQATMEADARWRRAPRPGKKASDRNALLQKELLGVRDLMTLTGRHHNDVIVWLRAGLLGNTVIRKDHTGRNVLKVPTPQVLRLLSLVQQTTTFRDAARTIGVDPLVLRTLSRQGRLPSLKMGKADFTARVRPEDVFAFANQVRSLARQSRANGQRPIDFSAAVRHVLCRRKSLFGKFLDELGTQRLPLRVFEKNVVYLNDTYIYHSDVLAWMARNA
jgi:hypothetical protein